MSRSRFSTSAFVLTAATLLAACGASTPEPELVDARNAYTRAQQSKASELAPAALDSARQALEKAEKSFERGTSPKAKTHAYIAIRRAEMAEAKTAELVAEKQYEEYRERYEELEEKRLNMTTEQLEAARRRLEEERRNFARSKEELSDQISEKEEELSEKQEELTEKQKELQAEREARKKAEGQLAAAIASLNEVGNVKEEARGVVITLSGAVLFATGKHELLPIAKNKLADVAEAVKDQGYSKIVVEGHTDSVGSEKNNQELSLKRARSVSQYLVSQGIEQGKIESVGKGESVPVAPNDTPEGRANNRRVEIIVNPEADRGPA